MATLTSITHQYWTSPSQIVDIDLNFDAPVNINWAVDHPTLTLSNGGQATLSGFSGNGESMIFAYQVQPGQSTSDLQISQINLGANYVNDSNTSAPADIHGTPASGGAVDLSLVPGADTGIVLAPSAPAVTLLNDTGISNSDGITNDPRLNITGVTDGNTLLYSTDGQNWTDTFTAVPGPNTVLVKQVDGNGIASPVSAPLIFTLEPPAPTLNQDLVPSNTVEANTLGGATVNLGISATGALGEPDPVTYTDTDSHGHTVPVLSGQVFGLGEHNITANTVDLAGNTNSTSFSFDVVDTTPPALTEISVPNSTVDANALGGAHVSFNVSATDAVDGTEAVTYTEFDSNGNPVPVISGQLFGLGEHTITAHTVDSSINNNSTTFSFDVLDVPPTLNLVSIPNSTVDANALGGAHVNFTVTATDIVDGTDPVRFFEVDLAHGTSVPVVPNQMFGLGEHTIVASTMDNAGKSNVASFSFDVVDTPPVLAANVVPPSTIQATSADGATVNFSVSATDMVDGTDPVTYTEVVGGNTVTVNPGQEFAIGAHTITAASTDNNGNSSNTTFSFDVVDSTAPSMNLNIAPASTIEGNALGGATVDFSVSATDTVDGTDHVTYFELDGNGHPVAVASGQVFGPGEHTIHAITADSAGNQNSTAFSFDVVDTTAPTMSLDSVPVSTVEGNALGGATVDFSVSATDTVDGSDPVRYFDLNLINGSSVPVAPGQVFGLGEHTIVAQTVDNSGNHNVTSFTFDVEDTTPPTLSQDSVPNSTVEATSANGANVNFSISATDTVDGTAAVTYTDSNGVAVQSGDTFGLGEHTVTAHTHDSAGNPNSTTFSFDVVDTTAPTLNRDINPASTTEATSANGASVNFHVSASDAVDGTDAVTYIEVDSNGNAVLDGNGTPVTVQPGDTFGLGEHYIQATATDNANNTGTNTFSFDVVDTTPPTLTLDSVPGSPVQANALGGAAVNFSASATDTVDGSDTVTYTELDIHGDPVTVVPGQVFGVGEHTVVAHAGDAAGNAAAPQSFTFDVVDNTPPTLTLGSVPASTIEGNAVGGATVNFGASATDTVDGTDNVTYTELDIHGDPVTVLPDQVFGLGEHTVTAHASDAAGNAAVTQNFTFDVVDTTAPTLNLGSAPHGTVQATSAGGAIVNLGVVANDAVDGTDPVTYREANLNDGTSVPVVSGQMFGLGEHTIVASTVDNAGNHNVASFTFDVVDTTAPMLNLDSVPGSTVEATSAAGASVNFSVSASDAVDVTDPVSYTELDSNGHTVSVTPGQVFGLGEHTITATTSDNAGNHNAASFSFDVVDAAPTLTLGPVPASTVQANTLGGATVDFSASATDTVDGTDPVTYSELDSHGHAVTVVPGQVFGVGEHTVTASATNNAGGIATGNFTFTVEDNTPPVLNLDSAPSGTVEANTLGGATVDLGVSATDLVDGTDQVTYTELDSNGDPVPVLPGHVFGLGDHTITATAQNSAELSTSQSFSFTVGDTTAPTLNLSSAPSGTVEANTLGGATVDLGVLATDVVDGTDQVIYTETDGEGNTLTLLPGHVFGLGRHTLTASAENSATLSTSQSFSFDVVDTTLPSVTLDTVPASVVAATAANGASVAFRASATDLVDGTATVTYSELDSNGHTVTVLPGQVFGLGHHTVSATARDIAGNTSSANFTFDVVNMTRPTLSLVDVPSRPIEASSAAGANVAFSVVATDLVDGTDPVTYSEVDSNGNAVPVFSGQVFGIGEHTITTTTVDSAGNAASRTFAFDVTDIQPPTITSQSGVTKTVDQVINGTGTPGDLVQLYNGQTAVGTPIAIGLSGTWAEHVSLNVGQNVFTATDANASTAYTSAPSASVTETLYTDVDPVTSVALPVMDLNQANPFSITNVPAGVPGSSAGDAYTGPVSGLQNQLIWNGTQAVAVTANTPNVFLHGGSGDDALRVTSGSNVLDGGQGSNFLVGAMDPAGTDTFFVDARATAPTWSTIVNFHEGDQATIWGFTGTNQASWVGQDGAGIYQGATLRAEIGNQQTSLTFAGLSNADAANLTLSTGSIDGQSYLLITR